MAFTLSGLSLMREGKEALAIIIYVDNTGAGS
jgi:hypothetical protein